MSRAVILAGGKGSRLGPYTTVLPKPLLPIGDRAVLDIVVRQLREYGFHRMTFAVGYLAHLIQAVFGDGSDRGVSIDYHFEEEPLGTAGPLATVEGLGETFLAMNGDVLTALNYADFLRIHQESGNALTIACHRRAVRTDYGVISTDGAVGGTRAVIDYEEKPEIPHVVSMGVYAAEQRVIEHIPPGERFDVPDLIRALIAAGEPVGSYLYEGYWLDIGRHDDYERAIIEYEQFKPLLLPGAEPVRATA